MVTIKSDDDILMTCDCGDSDCPISINVHRHNARGQDYEINLKMGNKPLVTTHLNENHAKALRDWLTEMLDS